MRNASRIMLVALLLWGQQLCPAGEPLSLAQAMQERSALGKALTNQFTRPGGEASAKGSPIDLNLVAALLVAAGIATHRLAPLLKGWFGFWTPGIASPADLVPSLLEEPSIIAFFEALKGGLAEPVADGARLAMQAGAPATARASDAAPDRLRQFYDATPRLLAELRTLLSESGNAPDEAARQTKLLEFCEQVSTLRENGRTPELLPIWQVVFALEGLLKRLTANRAGLSASVVRTVAGALDLLERLCRQRVKPNLMTEPPVRLLAVDDNPISGSAISQALTRLFDAPDLAPDGQAALALASKQTYDVIFLDVEMPGMEGFELCAKIHETERNRSTPVVFVTCHSDFAAHAKSTVNGGYDLLGKPFLVYELILKAITLVLQIRLGQGAAEPCAASNEAPGASIPAAPVAPCAPAEPPAQGLPKALCMSQIGKSWISNISRISESWVVSRSQWIEKLLMNRRMVERASPLVPVSLAHEISTAGNKTDAAGGTPAPLLGLFGAGAPTASKCQGVLSAEALAPLPGLLARLQEAQQYAAPTEHLELLGELYVHVHAVCDAAQRTQLDAAFRLGSALENMLKKLLEQPKSLTPSTVQAAAAALELLLDLGRTGANPDLACPPIQLLVVDDDPVVRRAICGSVQLAFGRPDSVESGEAALRLANEKSFDLIFLDVRMDGMDGFTACSRIHQTRLNLHTPVVFVTGYDDLDSRAKAAAAGGWGFIPKQVMASQIKLVALSFVLHNRLGKQVPALEAPPSLMGHDPESASPAPVLQETTPLGLFSWATSPVSSKGG
jgi:CheY-like chemotaxis protein